VDQIETHPFHQQVETQKFLQENGLQTLDTGKSSFFDHRDPAMVKRLSEAVRNT
jgi:hypothetical protein